MAGAARPASLAFFWPRPDWGADTGLLRSAHGGEAGRALGAGRKPCTEPGVRTRWAPSKDAGRAAPIPPRGSVGAHSRDRLGTCASGLSAPALEQIPRAADSGSRNSALFGDDLAAEHGHGRPTAAPAKAPRLPCLPDPARERGCWGGAARSIGTFASHPDLSLWWAPRGARLLPGKEPGALHMLSRRLPCHPPVRAATSIAPVSPALPHPSDYEAHPSQPAIRGTRQTLRQSDSEPGTRRRALSPSFRLPIG